jgi:hypothetical protein
MTPTRIPYYIPNPEFKYYLKLDCILVYLLVSHNEDIQGDTMMKLYPKSNLYMEGYRWSIINGNDVEEFYDSDDYDEFEDKYDNKYYRTHKDELQELLTDEKLYEVLRTEYNTTEAKAYLLGTVGRINKINNDVIDGPQFIETVYDH